VYLSTEDEQEVHHEPMRKISPQAHPVDFGKYPCKVSDRRLCIARSPSNGMYETTSMFLEASTCPELAGGIRKVSRIMGGWSRLRQSEGRGCANKTS